jgi:hypothetical protein
VFVGATLWILGFIEIDVYSIKKLSQIKDDAIAQLSDQVRALTARMQEFERKQQPSQ